MTERPHLPRGIGSLAVQPHGDDREALVTHARERGYGLEVGDFAFPEVLDDAARCSALISWYRERLAEIPGPQALHGPFFDLHPTSIDPKIATVSRDRIMHCLDIAETLEVGVVVLHSDFKAGVLDPGYPAKWIDRAGRFWREVMTGRMVALALENMWDRSPDTLRKAVDAIGLESAGVCFDAAHAHLHSATSLTEWVDVLGARIRRLHLSDNNRQWDQHLALGQGTAGWTSLFAALDVAGVEAPATLEMGGVESVQATAMYLRRLASTRVGGKR